MTPHDTTGNGTDDDGTDETGRTRRREFLAATGASVGAFGLAGCVGNLGGPGSGGGGGSGPIKVGHIAPVQLDMGKGSMRSARLAVEEINNNGGIMDRDVKLVEGDTQASPSQASNLVNEMVNQNDVSMISGTFASEVMLGVVNRVGNANVPFIDTGAASLKITQNYPAAEYETYKNVFRVGPVNSTSRLTCWRITANSSPIPTAGTPLRSSLRTPSGPNPSLNGPRSVSKRNTG
jgi:branched-chain amino acid transport system substrate-binding protein